MTFANAIRNQLVENSRKVIRTHKRDRQPMTTTQPACALDRITQRANGRKAARTACSLVDINDMTEQIKIGFWLEMINMMPDELKNQVASRISDQEAIAFESRQINFGQHAGKAFSEVPISYLTWIADSSNGLQAYLKSDRGQKRIEVGE